MAEQKSHRPLTEAEIGQLLDQGCTCPDWSKVQVIDGFEPGRVRNTQFSGTIRLGSNAGTGSDGAGIEKTPGVYNACLHDCTVADGVRIANVGVHLARYDVASGACIENVGTVETRPGATFGNGVEIEPVNEGGGREVTLFSRIDSQFAYLQCLHRHRPKLAEGLAAVAAAEVEKARSDRGLVGAGATVRNVKRIVDVNVGPAAVIDGATSLTAGTVLSTPEAPTTIGPDVQAEEFIIAEGAVVDGGALVNKSYVGQGCRIGRQFSSEGSLFFANCEGFHGEACSVLAGPYTVTHHKSTLLIAGLFSFYNAGSGTNQSNHLYKLGPVHEGRLERGCKTGSFSYMMWPCRVGPFSVVLGKHTRTFDTAIFPFSYLEATPEGRCMMTPAFNLTTVGTVRDGAKWPTRDRRRGPLLRDRISFDVFSPLTVGRMIQGRAKMTELQETTDRKVDVVTVGGADVKRVLLRVSQKFYRSAIHMYLLEKVVDRIEKAMDGGAASWADALAVKPEALLSEDWVDVGGQLMPKARLENLSDLIESGTAGDLDAITAELDRIAAAYDEDEWAWVRWAYGRVFEKELDTLTAEDLVATADELVKVRKRYINLVLNDAAKEFDTSSRTGFGHDGSDADTDADFATVRGDYETNTFVRQMNEGLQSLGERIERFKAAVARG